MPFFGREFYGDLNVIAMTVEQQGAYIRLLWLCWQEGAIPADLATLAAVCGNMPEPYFQERVWPKLCGLFEARADGRLAHHKIESIRDGKELFRSKCSEAGKVGNQRRWGNHRVPDASPMATRSIPESGLDRETIASDIRYPISDFRLQTTTKTLCSSDDERCDTGLELTPPKARATDEVKIWFDGEFWPAYPRKIAKPQALKAARHHAKTAAARTAIMECLTRRLPDLQTQYRTDGDYRPYPASWLNQQPWNDPEETARPATNPAGKRTERSEALDKLYASIEQEGQDTT